METIAQRAEGTLEAATIPPVGSVGIGAAQLKHIASNLGIAAVFFWALVVHLRNYRNLADVLASLHHTAGISDFVWMIGAGLMGALSLIRVPPAAAMINVRSVFATAAMMVTPAFIIPRGGSTGTLAAAGLMIECCGVILSEGSRIYLGRRFGFLPANRGIVSSGPFGLIRHPIYSGFLILTIGLVMAYPNPRNLVILGVSIPLMILRIDLEEELLARDAEYRDYCATTRYRLIPFVY